MTHIIVSTVLSKGWESGFHLIGECMDFVVSSSNSNLHTYGIFSCKNSGSRSSEQLSSVRLFQRSTFAVGGRNFFLVSTADGCSYYLERVSWTGQCSRCGTAVGLIPGSRSHWRPFITTEHRRSLSRYVVGWRERGRRTSRGGGRCRRRCREAAAVHTVQSDCTHPRLSWLPMPRIWSSALALFSASRSIAGTWLAVASRESAGRST